MFDREAAREVLRHLPEYGEEAEGEDSAIDALAGCVRPVPPQTIDRDALSNVLLEAYGFIYPPSVNRILALLRPVEVVAPDSRFDTIRALHTKEPVNDGGKLCEECARVWPCATIRALDGENPYHTLTVFITIRGHDRRRKNRGISPPHL